VSWEKEAHLVKYARAKYVCLNVTPAYKKTNSPYSFFNGRQSEDEIEEESLDVFKKYNREDI